MSIDNIYTLIIVAALLWPLIKLLVRVVYERFKNRLPAYQQDMLERYSKMAVRYVEQAVKDTNDEKKAHALDMVKKLLLSAKLPVPNMVILSAAIEAAVWLLKQEQKS